LPPEARLVSEQERWDTARAARHSLRSVQRTARAPAGATAGSRCRRGRRRQKVSGAQSEAPGARPAPRVLPRSSVPHDVPSASNRGSAAVRSSLVPHIPAPAITPRPSCRIKSLAPSLVFTLCAQSLAHATISLVSRVPSGPGSNTGSTLVLTPGRDHLCLGHAALELCPGTNLIHDISADAPAFMPSENPAGWQKCSLIELHEIQLSFTSYNHLGIFYPRWKQIFFMKICFNQNHI